MLLPLQLFELQINAMKNYDFNNKKTKLNQTNNKTPQQKMSIRYKDMLNIF